MAGFAAPPASMGEALEIFRAPAPDRMVEHRRRGQIARLAGKPQHGSRPDRSPQTDPLRRQPPGQAPRRRRHRRARGHLEAQCPVSARRLPLLLLRHHGCDRRQPLSAGADLSQGQARAGGLYRLRHGDLRGASSANSGPAISICRCSAARRRCSTRWLTSRSSAACDGWASSSAFLPADGEGVLRQGLSNCDIVDAVFPLERLRASKTPEEIAYLREASERVVASMLTAFAACKPGVTKHEVTETLAPRGSQSRPRLRLLPAHRRNQPQSRPLRAAPC